MSSPPRKIAPTWQTDDGRIRLYRGDCLAVLRELPSGSVQCCITSPPYWGLRCYGVEGQYGLERTPEEYVAKMAEVFREVRRVLRNDGTLWLNMGDRYTGSANSGGHGKQDTACRLSGMPTKTGESLKPKDLVGVPWRLAFALQADGWYLRSDIIWHKPNPMPESVTDRPTKSHEYIFLLTKRAKYYYDAEAVKEPATYAGQMRGGSTNRYEQNDAGMDCKVYNFRNSRTVWTMTPRPFSEAHFATFPPELPERCIKAGTSERGCCPECGAPWGRVVNRSAPPKVGESSLDRYGNGTAGVHRKVGQAYQNWLNANPTKTIGWRPICKCPVERAVPCVVLDPFNGAGTTGMVCAKLGQRYIGIDLNAEYLDMSRRRIQAAIADQGLLAGLEGRVTALAEHLRVREAPG